MPPTQRAAINRQSPLPSNPYTELHRPSHVPPCQSTIQRKKNTPKDPPKLPEAFPPPQDPL
jgi:hypothetical protein